jgi:hypothetical protein
MTSFETNSLHGRRNVVFAVPTNQPMKTDQTVSQFLSAAGAMIAAVLLFGACPASAQVTEMLHSTPTGTLRDNYDGVVGCQVKIGSTNVVVSHLGIYGTSSGLNASHIAGVMDTSLGVLGQVTVPAGTAAYFTNGFWWVPLDPPLLLSANGTYNLGGTVANGDGDGWQDAFGSTWNTFFIGSQATTTRHAMYGSGVAGWPPASFSQNGNNTTYGNVSLAYIEVDQARVGVQVTNTSLSAGQTLSVIGFASGQQPISYQWYKSPNTLLPDQTNAVLTIANASTNDSGTYFLTATNALGGEQSANVAALITSFPVGITSHPTNLTVFANYPASFSITATGSPPVSFQWFRNGAPISGATLSDYTIAAASLTNNGDVYSCVASNFTSYTPYTAVSSNAVLTVIPNLAMPQAFLHGARTSATNNFGGLVGGQFTVGNSPVLVTHLGYYANGGTNLALDHHVGIFSANGSVLYGSVVVPAGNYPDPTGAYIVTNGYEWAPLNPPLVLSNNTQYLLLAEVFSGSPTPDPWGDTYSVADLNPYFASACDAVYWGGAWPNAGVAGQYSGQMYSAPNLAILALPSPSAFVAPTTVTQYVGFNTTLTATVAGQPPVTLGWFKDSSPLSERANLILNLTNLSMGDAGNYYVIATNPVATAQSGNATLTVLPDVGPTITQDIQSQDVFVYQNVQFVAGADGTPTLNYRWTFNGNTIPGVTGNVLSLANVSAANVGSYQFIVTNNWGAATSSVASLTIETVPPGTYAAAVMGTNLLAYYRFSDVSSGFGIATNQGTLGHAINGTYEGTYSGVAGPTGFSNFEPDNQAVSLSGYDADVLIPSFGSLTVANLTLAAWVYDGGGQFDNTAILFHRSSSIFGLSIGQTNGEWLKYTWNNGFFNNYTGLILPTNQWAFVAMVISPTNAAIYLQNGTSMQSTNFAGTYPAASLNGNSYIGWDTAGGSSGRRWGGSIDEVMVFNQALSPSAINALYAGIPASVTLNLARSGNNLVLSWPWGTLLEATNLAGPWTTNNATSPYTVSPTGAMKFFKVQVQ